MTVAPEAGPAAAAGGTAAEVTFHFRVPDRLQYLCRLLRKAYRAGVSATVVGDGETIERLDRLLWTFDPQAFVPHVRCVDGRPPEPHLLHTPLWLVESLEHAPPDHRVLVQLCDTVPPGIERYDRIHEVVSLEPEALEPARARWRAHAAAGRALVRHDATAAG